MKHRIEILFLFVIFYNFYTPSAINITENGFKVIWQKLFAHMYKNISFYRDLKDQCLHFILHVNMVITGVKILWIIQILS